MIGSIGSRLALAAFALFIQAMPIAAQAQTGTVGRTNSAATERFHQVIELVNHGDRAAVTAWARHNVAPNRTAEWLAGRILALQDGSRGYEVVSYEVLQPDATAALVRNRLTGMLELVGVHIEPAAPHRVTMLPKGSARFDPATTPTRALSEAEASGQLKAYFGRLAEEGVLSGVILVAKDGRTILHEAYGEANRDFGVPNRPDTRFDIGSMNKMFTAVAIAQLVEAGKLAYEDPLSKYLPDFPTPEAAKRIRIEHLLTHSAGLGNYQGREREASALPRTVDDYLALVRGQEPAFEPGTRYRYSNTGYLTLGKVIEVVSGKDYFTYVREHIYEPAGMQNSGTHDRDRVNQNLAVGYGKDLLMGGYHNNLFHGGVRGGPAGGGYSTAGDLLRFAQALRNGTLVSPATFEHMITPRPEYGAARYGYGFIVDTSGERVVGHNGGWFGVYTKLDINLDKGYTAVVLTNLNPGEPDTTFEQKIRQTIGAIGQ